MSRSTLIVLALVFTVFAFVASDVDFWRDHAGHGRVHVHSNTLLTSFAIASSGEIELDEERGEVVAMSPDAYLEIRERRLTTRRRLEVRPDSSGRPVYTLEVGSRQRSEAEAKEYLAARMDEILTSTTIGAAARARRLANEGGVERILEELPRLERNSLRRIYLEEAVRVPDLDLELARRLVGAAGREITSSSQLGTALRDLAEALPAAWPLTGELARAAGQIPSSSERASTLVDIVARRGLTPADVRELADAVASIPSSSQKGGAIRRLIEAEPSADMVAGMIDAAATIDSSSERRRALGRLVEVPDLPDELYLEALGAAEEIASSAEKATFLVELSAVLPAHPALESRYVELAATIASSSEEQRALLALLAAHDLGAPACVDWIRAASEVPSSAITATLLIAAAERCPATAAVDEAYLGAVEEIPSSSDQRRVLLARIARGELDADTRAEIAAVAQRAIPSADDRAAVLERLAVSDG